MTRGITIEDKLNKICPLYDRWEAIFSERPNFEPPYVMESLDYFPSSDEEGESFFVVQEETPLNPMPSSSLSLAGLMENEVPGDAVQGQSSEERTDSREASGGILGPSPTPINPHLVAMANESARLAKESGEGSGLRNAGLGGKKRDFASAYADSAEKRAIIRRDQAHAELEWKKKHAEAELDLKREALQQARSKDERDGRNAIVIEAMRLKMSAEEARQYVELMCELNA
jgi:hypothetical protein